MSLIARMIIPISVIVTLATSFIGWKAYSDARDSVAEATRILEISTLDAVGRVICGGPCSTSQASTGWPSSIAGGP